MTAGLNLYAKAIAVRSEAQKTRIKIEARTRLLSFSRQCWDQTRAFDDQVGLCQRHLRGAAVGEQFETANLVDDAFNGGRP